MKKNSIIKLIVIIALCIITECIISNFSAISLKLSGAEKYDIDLSSVTLDGKNAELTDGGIVLKKGIIAVQDINTEIKNLYLELSGEYYEFVDVDIAYLDDNFAYRDGYDYNCSTVSMYVGDNRRNYCKVSSFGEVKNLRITVGDTTDFVTVSAITLNKIPDFHFSILRCVILFMVVFVVAYGAWKMTLRKSDYILLRIIAALMCVMVYSTILNISNKDSIELLDVYPAENLADEDQYRQLFESFKQGRLDLAVDYDAEALQALDNPYDRSERNAKNATGDYWDRAYYDGKFYSYFGTAPVFTVYYPVYILTGYVATAEYASALLCIYAIIFISLLYIEFLKRFCKDVPLVLAFLGEIAVIFGSGIFAAALDKRFYYMAVISGITWTAAFLYFLLKAYYEENFKKRIIFLVLTGLSVALIAASRPTMLLYGAAAVVPALFIFTSKKESIKNKICYISAIGMPVAVGAVLIMNYNFKRFGNPFEFGFNYQLTVSMAKANTFSFAMIPATIYHYFIQQPNINTNFPYIEIKSKALSNYGRFNYNGRTMGILNYPVTWGLMLTPVFCRKKDKFKTAFILILIVSALLMAYIDMCKAGSHYRYTLDILMPVITAATVAIFDSMASLKKLSNKIYITSYVFTALAMSATIYLGYLMAFANELRTLLTDFTVMGYILQNL